MKTDTLHLFEILLKNPEGITRDEINRQLEKEGTLPIDRHTFGKMLESLRHQYHVDIKAERVNGLQFRYQVPKANTHTGKTISVLLANLLESRFLEEFQSLGTRIQAIDIPHGHEYLRIIGLAMKRDKLLECRYQKFTDTEPYDCLLAPYVLKAFEGRWYLFALKWNRREEMADHPMGIKDIGLQAFALDRIQHLCCTEISFSTYKGFNASTYFKPFFGVYCKEGAKPVKIVVRAGEDDAHYIRTLPIHHTQRETERGVFTLRLCPTKDFKIYMRRYANSEWQVVEEETVQNDSLTMI